MTDFTRASFGLKGQGGFKRVFFHISGNNSERKSKSLYIWGTGRQKLNTKVVVTEITYKISIVALFYSFKP